ncbi:hypothetical protein HMPREF1155_1210 [Slackia sp. CM382]|uniref:Uncharacterized protein n=1 Tax=Slackia exigua (strain ATCC 700122 / DSM 15923 / CIP 105133 / JCM 11022 / KCTC 5966 / S-7) TaxID=649764 RepID=D0WJM8_SLAES|nr:hypothetical protein HMPREF0762_02055 [Slackia exigua ATCC 700122]EJU33384.1 hypothetical protein HMPREF1155_1210 [Slackia sp. CM382]
MAAEDAGNIDGYRGQPSLFVVSVMSRYTILGDGRPFSSAGPASTSDTVIGA